MNRSAMNATTCFITTAWHWIDTPRLTSAGAFFYSKTMFTAQAHLLSLTLIAGSLPAVTLLRLAH